MYLFILFFFYTYKFLNKFTCRCETCSIYSTILCHQHINKITDSICNRFQIEDTFFFSRWERYSNPWKATMKINSNICEHKLKNRLMRNNDRKKKLINIINSFFNTKKAPHINSVVYFFFLARKMTPCSLFFFFLFFSCNKTCVIIALYIYDY